MAKGKVRERVPELTRCGVVMSGAPTSRCYIRRQTGMRRYLML